MKMGPVVKKNDCDGLKPVFYNFSRRRLYTNDKMPMNAKHFLELCHGINDPNVQLQVRKYDKLTSNKKKLIVATIACGVGGYVGLFSSMIMTATSGPTPPNTYNIMGASAIVLFAAPILAISTSIPHQKRKQVLFHDLPEAYNFYVTSQSNQ